MWKQETQDVKDHYQALALQCREQHQRDYPGYKYAPRRPGERNRRGVQPKIIFGDQNSNTFNIPLKANSNQSQINFPSLTPARKKELDILAAMWCFLGNHPFNMYENAVGKKFLKEMNPAYEPPGRKAIAGPLLDSVYTMTKSRTDDMISAMNLINIVTDESSNIRGSRIWNISVHSPYGPLHYISEDIRAQQMTAAAAAQWLRNHLLVLSNNDLSRINSIITDTCALIAMWMEMQRFIELKYCLFIPCDSHEIQLLVKDLLEIPIFKDTLQKAQKLVKAFRHSLLQYARLRDFQLQYGTKKHQSLILSVITRWGTQFRLLQSVLNSKDALKRYAHEFGDLPAKTRLNQASIDTLRDPQFWRSLEPLRELLLPLDEALRMSESGSSHLGHVLPRWMAIAEHLAMRRRLDYPEALTPFMSDDHDTGFAARYKRQVMPVHVAAYYLFPETRNKPIPENFESQLQVFFRQFTSSEADYETLNYEFESFRAQVAPFENGRRCWTLPNDPKLFWHAAMNHTKLIGKLGYRLFSAPCKTSTIPSPEIS